MRTSFVRIVAATLLATTLSAVTATTAGATPKTPSAPAAPSATSSGVNDWSCRPSAQHPDPVVLLHGTFAPSAGHWSVFAPYLASQGYCVFYFTYGKPVWWSPVGGFRPIDESAREIATFVDEVRAATHAAKVDLVGHSQGGFLSLYVPKVLNLGSKVGTVVALAPPTRGTDVSGLVKLADYLGVRPTVDFLLSLFGCQACSEILPGGKAVKALNNGPVAAPGVRYTVIASRADILVTPHEDSFVREPGVNNVFVQDSCPADIVGHIGMAFDLDVFDMVTNALDPATARTVRCSIGLPF